MEQTKQDYTATVAEIERIAQAHNLFAHGLGQPVFEGYTMRRYSDPQSGVSLYIIQDEVDGPITLSYLFASKINARVRGAGLSEPNHEIYKLIPNE